MEHDYSLRGTCYEACVALIEQDSTLELVRGWYHCPVWGRQEHWWLRNQNNEIHDPTAAQFPSLGIGEYEEYLGVLTCEQCGCDVVEADAYIDPPHVFCSYTCYGRCVMG